MINLKKLSIKNILFLKKANYFELTRGANKISDVQIKELVQNESKGFSDWLVQRVKEGKGTDFDFSSLPEELRAALNSVPNSVDNRLEEKTSNFSAFRNPSVRVYNEQLSKVGYITQSEIREIVQSNSDLFKEKYIYNSPLEAIRAIKKFTKNAKLITLQVVLNLDFSREEHQIPQQMLKLPYESEYSKDICVITSEENFALSHSCGAKGAITAAKLASVLEEKTFFHKKIIATEEQYVDLLDYCKDKLQELGIEMPTRENGRLIKSDDLKQVLVFLSTNHVNLKIMKRSSPYIHGSEYFNKIVQVELGDARMREQELLTNMDYILKNLSEKQPVTIEGRYFLTAVLIVNNKVFRIKARSLDPKLEEYRWQLSLN